MLDIQQTAQTESLPQTAEELYARIEPLYGRVVKIVSNAIGGSGDASTYEYTRIGRIEGILLEKRSSRKTELIEYGISLQLQSVTEGSFIDFDTSNVWVLQEDRGQWVLVHAGPKRTERFFARFGIGGDLTADALKAKELTA